MKNRTNKTFFSFFIFFISSLAEARPEQQKWCQVRHCINMQYMLIIVQNFRLNNFLFVLILYTQDIKTQNSAKLYLSPNLFAISYIRGSNPRKGLKGNICWSPDGLGQRPGRNEYHVTQDSTSTYRLFSSLLNQLVETEFKIIRVNISNFINT